MRALTGLGIGMIRAYQYTLRGVLGANCRFMPSCSDYAIEALRAHGPARGTALAVWRVLRCNPWTEGGFDPVPDGQRHDCSCDFHRGVAPAPADLIRWGS